MTGNYSKVITATIPKNVRMGTNQMMAGQMGVLCPTTPAQQMAMKQARIAQQHQAILNQQMAHAAQYQQTSTTQTYYVSVGTQGSMTASNGTYGAGSTPSANIWGNAVYPSQPPGPNPYGTRNVYTRALMEGAVFDDDGTLRIPEAFLGEIILPDGAKITGDKSGVRVDDKDAKVLYRAGPLDFNRYLNASDLLEEFIAFAGNAGAGKIDILNLPMNLFITFLIIRAAEADGEEPPDDVVLQIPKPKIDRCGYCARFIKPALAAKGLVHCNALHFERHMERLAA